MDEELLRGKNGRKCVESREMRGEEDTVRVVDGLPDGDGRGVCVKRQGVRGVGNAVHGGVEVVGRDGPAMLERWRWAMERTQRFVGVR